LSNAQSYYSISLGSSADSQTQAPSGACRQDG